MLEQLTEYVTGNPWTYGVVFAIAAIDAFFPLVPSETVLITAGTLSTGGDLLWYGVIPAGALGAFAGDNFTYMLGATLGERAALRLTGERGRRRLAWARRLLDEHGALIIITARFIPGGRTATMLAAGTVEMTWRRFVLYDAVAVTVWSTYSTMIGYLGGTAFEENLWLALGLGFGIALAVAALIEAGRRWRHLLQGKKG